MSKSTAVTRLSSKGQVVLPKAVREHLGWRPGARLTIENTADGVLLRRAPLFPPTELDQVFGSLRTDRPPVSIEEMDAAVEAEARLRARD